MELDLSESHDRNYSLKSLLKPSLFTPVPKTAALAFCELISEVPQTFHDTSLDSSRYSIVIC
jgi:hypothetical protein